MNDIPFVIDNLIVFEIAGPELLVGDLANSPAMLNVEAWKPGLYQLPGDAVKQASRDEEGSFDVDSACFFIAPPEAYAAIQKELNGEPFMPGDGRLEELRERLSCAFGFVISGDLDSLHFNGDGTYVLEMNDVAPFIPGARRPKARLSSREIVERALRQMNTLVCTQCFGDEIMEHPELGMCPRDANAKRQWVAATAEYARQQGWIGTAEPSEFGDFAIKCPECASSGP